MFKPTLKFLGLQPDSHRTWMIHINSLLHKLSTVCFIMRRLSHILNIDTLRIVCFVRFHTLIKYSTIFWGTSTTVHKVFLIQKRIIRIKLGIVQRRSCRNRFKDLDILTVPSLYFFFYWYLSNCPVNIQANSSILYGFIRTSLMQIV